MTFPGVAAVFASLSLSLCSFLFAKGRKEGGQFLCGGSWSAIKTSRDNLGVAVTTCVCSRDSTSDSQQAPFSVRFCQNSFLISDARAPGNARNWCTTETTLSLTKFTSMSVLKNATHNPVYRPHSGKRKGPKIHRRKRSHRGKENFFCAPSGVSLDKVQC